MTQAPLALWLPQTNDFGVAKDGKRKDSFQLGMALTGEVARGGRAPGWLLKSVLVCIGGSH